MFSSPSNVVRQWLRPAFMLAGLIACADAQDAASAGASAPKPMYIREYRVRGAKVLKPIEVQEVVYPFLGPGRLPADVDQARAALESAYREKGYEAVTVIIPEQSVRGGVVMLEVVENPVGRLRVKGSSYTSPSAIKALAPSMAEGKPVDFKQVKRDIVALNQYPSRQVKPDLRAGVEPGTVDIDLIVKDELPLHGCLELNNRYSANTTPLRINAAMNYDNLWQLGHTLGLNTQIAPENPDDGKVFSAYYLARVQSVEGLSLMLTGTKQDSNVSTLGGLAVAGRGEIIGLRAIRSFTATEKFHHSFSFGIDYKNMQEDLISGVSVSRTPITYYPFSALYIAGWKGDHSRTEFNGGVTFHMRGMGSSGDEFDEKRFKSDGSFIYFRGDLSHTHDWIGDSQWFAKIQGQASSQPLINSEQFAGGGLGSVRGYLESEVLGDDALYGTLELRSPSLISRAKDSDDDWRVYGFVDAGVSRIQQGLPGQDTGATLASAGVGTRGRLFDHLNGSLDAGLPLLRRENGEDRAVTYTFRLWGDF